MCMNNSVTFDPEMEGVVENIAPITDTSVLHHVFLLLFMMFFIHNNAFWNNPNAFSLIICKVHTKRENSGS